MVVAEWWLQARAVNPTHAHYDQPAKPRKRRAYSLDGAPQPPNFHNANRSPIGVACHSASRGLEPSGKQCLRLPEKYSLAAHLRSCLTR